MSWLRERVESKTGHTVQLPPGIESWLPSVLAQVASDVVSALTYAVIDERDQPKGQLSFVLCDWPSLDDLGRVRHRPTGLSRLRFQRTSGRRCWPNAASRRCYVTDRRGLATHSG
jgi:hypothetical protein